MLFSHHDPVLCEEVLKYWGINPLGSYIDATFGRGGHTKALRAKELLATIWICDRDREALETTVALEIHPDYRLSCNYSELQEKILPESIDGILADLGLCSGQLDNPKRGFSFRLPGPLDMRMDLDSPQSLSTYLSQIGEDALAKDIFQYGEEKRSRLIAKEILTQFRSGQIQTTKDLVSCITKYVKHRAGEKHPATRTFQALRIAVNQELHHLTVFLQKAPLLLKDKGLLSIISFHSLEYTRIKEAYQDPFTNMQFQIHGFKMKRVVHPLFPSESEQERNPRSRSARLHVYQKIAAKP